MESHSDWIHAEASLDIEATPQALYEIVVDYRVGHPAILPKQFFIGGLEIEKGGKGAGTVLRGKLKVLGTEYGFHQEVTEPEPGRKIVETDIETGQVSWFTFDSLDGGVITRVTIASDFPPSPGIVGFLERFMKPGIIRDIYNKELHQLAEYVASKQGQS